MVRQLTVTDFHRLKKTDRLSSKNSGMARSVFQAASPLRNGSIEITGNTF